MPVSPVAVASMLACARIGAVHTIVFAGFSAESLSGRINDGKWEHTGFSFYLLYFVIIGTCLATLGHKKA